LTGEISELYFLKSLRAGTGQEKAEKLDQVRSEGQSRTTSTEEQKNANRKCDPGKLKVAAGLRFVGKIGRREGRGGKCPKQLLVDHVPKEDCKRAKGFITKGERVSKKIAKVILL